MPHHGSARPWLCECDWLPVAERAVCATEAPSEGEVVAHWQREVAPVWQQVEEIPALNRRTNRAVPLAAEAQGEPSAIEDECELFFHEVTTILPRGCAFPRRHARAPPAISADERGNCTEPELRPGRAVAARGDGPPGHVRALLVAAHRQSYACRGEACGVTARGVRFANTDDDERAVSSRTILGFWQALGPARGRSIAVELCAADAFLVYGSLSEAESAYRRVLEADGQPRARLGLARVLFRQNRFAEAASQFQASSQTEGFGSCDQVSLASALRLIGQSERAEAVLMDVRPDTAEVAAAVELGRAYLASGNDDPEVGLQHTEQCLSLLPWSAVAMALRLKLLRRLGRQDECVRLIDLENSLEVAQLPGADPAFNAALVEELKADGRLAFDESDPTTCESLRINDVVPSDRGPLAILTRRIIEACEAFLLRAASRFPRGYLASPPPMLRLNGWCLVMRSEGATVPHLHPRGFVSGAYYVQIPPPRRAGDDAGDLIFRIGGDDGPSRVITPQAGNNVLFPSFYGHRTVPNRSNQSRIVIAYDMIPMDPSNDPG